MKFGLIFMSLMLVSGIAFSQDFEIKGKITDNEGRSLGSATVYLEKPADSSLVTYTISKENGDFRLVGNSPVPKLNIYVSYAGYKPYIDSVPVRNKDLGTLKLKLADNQLDEISITARRAPVSIKTDTLEFNAASFKTREDANLEAVLKELPGVDVDSEGNITVNGKPVSRILVNGKEFFGDDPKIATKNLPKEIIDKIQVVDTKTKSEEFTGKEGDSENKTINITIDEDKNRGFFSRLTAGGGTNDRYELSAISNYFKDDLRMSLLASSNNINSSGFTFDEVYDAMGRNAYSIARNSNGSFSINGNSFGGGGSGITETDNIGFSLVNEWPKKTEASLNYFYNHADNRNEVLIERENILPDGRFFVESNSSSTRINDNHRFSTSFEVQPDTLTRISFRPNFNASQGKSFSESGTRSLDENGNLINTTLTRNETEVVNTNFSNRLYFARKFGTSGGFYSLSFSNENRNHKEKDLFYSEREIIGNEGATSSLEIQDQLLDIEEKRNQYSVFSSLRIPISENWDIDFEAEYENVEGTNERMVYNASAQGEYDLLNETLSNDFRTQMNTFKPALGLVYSNDTLRFGIAGGLLHTRLVNDDVISGTAIDETYSDFFVDSNLRYSFNKSKSVYLSVRNSRRMPEIRQLQPVRITTNPLNVIQGNPDLAPTMTTRIYLNFNNYDWESRSGFYLYAGGEVNKDEVVTTTTTDENLVRTTTYTNLNGAYNLYAGASLDKKIEIDSVNTIKVEPGIYGNYNRRLGFSNAQQFQVDNVSLNPHIDLEYDLKDKLTLEPGYRLGIVNADYSLNDRNENYLNHELNFQVTSYWPENFIFGSDFSYQKFGNISPGFKNQFYLWNASLGYKLLGDDGILKVKIFDILDENTATKRVTGDDFIQDTQELVLERYLMFSFTYKFSKFGGKDPNKKGNRFF